MSIHVAPGVVVIMDPAPVVYAKLFYEGSEPSRYLGRSARAVAALATVLAPRGRTGVLAGSIKADQNRTERGQYTFGYSVGTSVYYAHYVHEGTGPSIREVADGHAMRFAGTDASSGKEVFTPIVFHPGTPSQPFLERALIAMVVG